MLNWGPGATRSYYKTRNHTQQCGKLEEGQAETINNEAGETGG